MSTRLPIVSNSVMIVFFKEMVDELVPLGRLKKLVGRPCLKAKLCVMHTSSESVIA